MYYSANAKHPYAHAFQEMFARKARSVATIEVHQVTNNDWDEHIKLVEKYLRLLIVTNRLPGQEGVDMLIVGDDRTKKLSHWAEVMEKKQGRPMNYVIMSRDDFLYRQSVRDRFLAEVLEMETTEVYDPERMLKTK